MTDFLIKHLVPALEAEFVAHAPEMQEVFLQQVRGLSDQVESWLINKAVSKVLPKV